MASAPSATASRASRTRLPPFARCRGSWPLGLPIGSPSSRSGERRRDGRPPSTRLGPLRRLLADHGAAARLEPVPAARAAMTVREQETLLRALDLWRVAVGQMTWEERAEASLALLIVRDEELEALRGRVERGEIQ